ncbi:MAG TPA: hypothetical protein VNC50_15335 [Planctomycetia bacterium]|jgi:hypothetical protein|nr:hypothetical protein [Planctomycetia bacterium]
MQRSTPGILIATALALAGCRTTSLPHAGATAPGKFVVRASQYAFTTDFPFTAADPLVDDLVGLRAKVNDELLLPAGQPLVRVVIFAAREDYAAFLKRNFPELPMRRAFFVSRGQDNLVVYACQGNSLRADLRHEATHALLHAAIPSIPLWLDEGLAEYFEVGPAAPGGNWRHVAALVAATKAGWKPDLARLEKMKDLRQLQAADYRESWLWAHYALHRTPTTKRALLEHLQAHKSLAQDSLEARLRKIEPKLETALLEHLHSLAADPAPDSGGRDSYQPPHDPLGDVFGGIPLLPPGLAPPVPAFISGRDGT